MKRRVKRARGTKLQRMNAAARKSKRARVARALRAYVDAQLGKGKTSGARVRRNPGGTLTIIPIKRRAKR